MKDSMNYSDMKNPKSVVYILQELPGTKMGAPKYNIVGASKFGELKTLLPENSQIIMSPGPLIFKLRKLLKDFSPNDYLLLTGDPAIIGISCSIVAEITGGKFSFLKWDRQEKTYYPIKVNLYEKGAIED